MTRSVPSGKTYNRKKEKQRIGKEFRNEFEADLFLQNYLFLLDYDATYLSCKSVFFVTVVLAASDKKSVHNNASSHFVVPLSFQK